MSDKEFDLFDCLRQINGKDGKYFSLLSETGKKEYSPFMIQRWLTGADDKRQLLMINTFVNPFTFEFQKDHKELLHKLFAVVSSGQNHRYKFPKQMKTSTSKMKMSTDIISKEYSVSKSEAYDYIATMTDDDIVAMAEGQGLQDKEIKALKKELKGK